MPFFSVFWAVAWLEKFSRTAVSTHLSWITSVSVFFLQNRNLPHRLSETDCRAVCSWRVPRKQRGGHQRATDHGRSEGKQTAVLSEPVTYGNHPSSPGPIINWNPQCWYTSICLGCNTVLSESALLSTSGVSSVVPQTIIHRRKCLNWFRIVIGPSLLLSSAKTGLVVPHEKLLQLLMIL